MKRSQLCARLGACVIVLLTLAPPPSHAIELTDATPLAGPGRLFHPFPLASITNAAASVVNPAGLAGRVSSDFLSPVHGRRQFERGHRVPTENEDSGAGLRAVRSIGWTRLRIAPHGGVRPLFLADAVVGVSYAWFFSEDDGLADLSSLDFGVRALAGPRIALAVAAYGWNVPDLDGVAIRVNSRPASISRRLRSGWVSSSRAR